VCIDSPISTRADVAHAGRTERWLYLLRDSEPARDRERHAMSSSDGARSTAFNGGLPAAIRRATPPESALAAPLLTDELRRVLAALPAMLRAARDRALLLVDEPARSAALRSSRPGLIPWPLRSSAVVDMGRCSRDAVVLARGEREVGRNPKGSVDLSMDSTCSPRDPFG
jgi:hypothetical protein